MRALIVGHVTVLLIVAVAGIISVHFMPAAPLVAVITVAAFCSTVLDSAVGTTVVNARDDENFATALSLFFIVASTASLTMSVLTLTPHTMGAHLTKMLTIPR